ncbi:DUF3302 domain-containing protein [Kiritimatiellota bacterium B12222]|nr:DUF3302 domain-containing protein [Kiritimatiellota bacterium B12222]
MKLEIISLSLIFLAVLTIILGIIKIHTYPGKIAKARNHPQKDAIEVTSLLGLIIFPFWMFALIWAYSGAVVGEYYIKEGDIKPKPESTKKKRSPKHKKTKQTLSDIEKTESNATQTSASVDLDSEKQA